MLIKSVCLGCAEVVTATQRHPDGPCMAMMSVPSRYTCTTDCDVREGAAAVPLSGSSSRGVLRYTHVAISVLRHDAIG